MDGLLTEVLDTLKAETPPKRKIAKRKFENGPLSQNELDGCLWESCYTCGKQVTEYQHRSLAVIKDSFYAKAVKKYAPENHTPETCILAVDEYQPMFNEIHRATAHYVSEGLSVQEALIKFIKA